MRRSIRGWLVSFVFIVCLGALFFAQVGTAIADPATYVTTATIEDRTPSGLPAPIPQSISGVIWINDYGKWDLHPGMTFSAIGGSVDGFVYTVDRTGTYAPVMPVPGVPPFNAYAPAPFGGGTTVRVQWDSATPVNPGLDMWGWLAQQSTPYTETGMTEPVEGRWYLNARTVVNSSTGPIYGVAGHGDFHVDVTPPSPVTGLRFVDPDAKTYNGFPLVGKSRTEFLWDNRTFSGGNYDALSGDSRWWFTLNGKVLMAPNGPAFMRNYPYGALSIENLRAGENTIGVSVVDMAGNISEPTALTVYSDGEVPWVQIRTPAAGYAAGGTSYTFTANATDDFGVANVTFRIDGTTIGVDSSAPYAITKSMAGYAHGSTHTLYVTAKDIYGHTTTVSRTFKVDKVAPALTNVYDTPDPFYPVLQDGYKDRAYYKFRIYERCTMYVNIYKANGTLWKQIKTVKPAGYGSISWDGKGSSGTVGTGTFTYRVGAKDAAGNIRWSARYPTTIRNYQLVRTSDGGVKVIPR